ncbi:MULTISPECIES: diphthamide biosynthesis enzyme Dph2 [unclassified Methanoregula]|uniref:diphthamide biosynthesis enzyme Dph2 n=1 Tax=unclassified Methanoregula TaxID=2649730 RepID=UPI0009D47B0A|nr:MULTISPECIES: diphthamide biosynthesis enzyme Dph2 [unclassified Methanoregula]OPX62284.1 MAG: 2-(3-amino-3-carboxypropyl)histidine synthase [Methanoregula sp. PtaB.Bin085]OPY32711.1 MAG: 2-(3-amino-3-carboxypropyl)histidine synthase [Methanoregula sp. PtaU1.Bin006]
MLSNDISDLVRQLRERRAKNVALQFPEGLKRRASAYAAALRGEGFDVVVSGDPCYGACDLALNALGNADVLVHVGHAPVGPQENVIFVPHEVGFDVAVLEKALPLLKGTTTGLVTTVQHAHLVPAMEAFLKDRGIDVRVSEGRGRTPLRGQVLGCCFSAAKDIGADEILFAGTGLFHPIGIALAMKVRVVALDPLTGIAQEVNADSLLRKRFAVIEKARGAKDFGIIVSTKSGQNRMDLARRLSALSPYAVIVTLKEVSPDELLNLGFGCYVNTACPRLAYDDQVRFPVPVLSPQEFEILCGTRSWDEYAIDEIP